MRILGIDPGSRVTGYGVVERVSPTVAAPARPGAAAVPAASGLRHVAHGTLRPPEGAGLAERLAFLVDAVADLVRTHAPERAVVEEVFVSTSPRAALVLGQARGAALAALAGAGLPVDELAAATIKKAVTGSGAAGKRQVQDMVVRLLALEKRPASDAADALAAAVCRAHAGPLAGLAWRGGRRSRGSRRASGAVGRFVVRRAP